MFDCFLSIRPFKQTKHETWSGKKEEEENNLRRDFNWTSIGKTISFWLSRIDEEIMAREKTELDILTIESQSFFEH